MKKFNGYEEAKKSAQYAGSTQIPVGAYVAKVINVRYDSFDWGDVIVLAFDIAEGEQKDFFKKQFDANTSEDKKWKGTVRVNVPKDDGSESDDWTKNSFARWTNSFEASNSDYAWDWDENKWKGLQIGLVFGQTGTVIDGKEVLYTEVHGCCSVDEAKNGTFYKKLLELKTKNGYTGTQTTGAQGASSDGFMQIADGVEEELPF